MKTSKITLIVLALLTVVTFACKKDEHVPPSLTFASGGNYTSANATVGTSASVKFGIVAQKTEDELKTVNVSYSYDGGASVSYTNYTLTGSQEDYFAQDVIITTRSTAGSEKWIFTVTDKDGNITTNSITLTVL